jgi:hypothetical protein
MSDQGTPPETPETPETPTISTVTAEEILGDVGFSEIRMGIDFDNKSLDNSQLSCWLQTSPASKPGVRLKRNPDTINISTQALVEEFCQVEQIDVQEAIRRTIALITAYQRAVAKEYAKQINEENQ